MTVQDLYTGRVRVRSCGLVVQNQRVLLVKQTVPTRTVPVWLPPGGEVKPGETAKAAAARECLEETGIQITGLNLRYIHEFIDPPSSIHALELYFRADSYSGKIQTGNDPEHDKGGQWIQTVQFVDFEKAASIHFVPDFLLNELISGSFIENRIDYFTTGV